MAREPGKGQNGDCGHAACSTGVINLEGNDTSPEPELDTLLEPGNVSKYWLEPNRKLLQPGTLRSHLGSLREFCSFLQAEKQPHVDLGKCKDLAAASARWSNALGKDTRRRAVSRAVYDMETAITPADLRKALASQAARDATMYLGMVDNTEVESLSKVQYALSRNYLMFHILALNAQRPGAVVNLTLRSIGYAQQKKCGKRLIAVSDHKTGYRTPATLVVTNALWQHLQSYLRIRKLHFVKGCPELGNSGAKVF